MSRMLDALRRIEDRRGREVPADTRAESNTSERPSKNGDRRPASCGTSTSDPQHPAASPRFQATSEILPPASAPPEVAAEISLQQLESAVALADQPSFDAELVQSTGIAALTPFLSEDTLPDAYDARMLSLLAELDAENLEAVPGQIERISNADRRVEDRAGAVAGLGTEEEDQPKESACLAAGHGPPPRATSAWEGGLLNRVGGSAEAYARLANHILDQLPSERPAALLFTSSCDNIEKTIILARLAPILAQRIGGEVLAVDAGLGGQSLAEHFGVEALSGSDGFRHGAAAWQRLVYPSPVPGLAVLAARELRQDDLAEPGHGDSGMILDWGRLLRDLFRQYRLVLVDAPSLVHSEAERLASSCDGTYLVVELRQTSARAARQASRLIAKSRGRLLGCIALA